MAKARYLEIADALRTDINAGRYEPGAALPSEWSLAAEFGAARGTVTRAFTQLAQEGLIDSSQGKGHRVRDWQPLRWILTSWERQHQRSGELDAWSSHIVEQGREPRQDVSVSIVVPPEPVRQRLGLEPDGPAVLRSRLRSVDDVPWQLSDSYFPASLAEGTALMTPKDISAPGGLLASMGYHQTHYVDEIGSRMPRSHEASALEITVGTPLIEHLRTGYDRDERPLRVMRSVCPGDRHVLVYEINA